MRAPAGLALATALLASCAPAGEDRSGPAPGTPTETPTEAFEGAGTLSGFFGGDVEPRREGGFGLDRWELLDGEDVEEGGDEPEGDALRVSFPEGSVSPSAAREHDIPEGGMQVYLPAADEDGLGEDVHLRYRVRLPEDFEFVKGGKLPGLYGGTETSGGEEPDGTDGFSTRLMWRRDGAGEVYLYAPDEPGTSLGRGSWTWPRGEWTCVEQRLELDAPEAEDGSVTVWLDGEQVLREQGLDLRTTDELGVDGVFFSTFYGGDEPDWAPEEDQHADFADFAVAGSRIGCDG